ncbi:ATP-binding protein [Thermoactinospora rubra]|uniref:ATP-binding protein n=1 Tax=Thermoactinospora rubra TaxID=1088767 RepID=UPI000A0F7FA7|nr:BTAD domain-containing putative transcriptional regulator [Thermoactinospora rubra]
MRFGVLGPLEVWADTGEEIAVAGPRPRALLVLLLLEAGRVVGVDRLVDGQYGQAPPANAANAIQAQVSRLRRTLPGLIEHHPTGYRLAVDPGDVDAHRFERLAAEGRRLLSDGDLEKAAATLKEALALWRGPALADLPAAGAQATRLEELRLTALEDLVEAELALPRGTSVAELRRLAEAHPLRERLAGQLMRALHAAGCQAEALAVYERVRKTLAEELGADPSPELAEIHLAVLRAEQPRRRGVAAPLTSFVGRERELAGLGGDRPATRLVTVVGPGGVGKTRLAVEAARRHPDACFVDLAPVTDHVAHAVLAALGVRQTGLGAADPVGRLVTAIGDRDLLLVLDNCEHVVASAAALARELLAECPRLRVLATSREPLDVTGETLVPLPPLAVPPPDVSPAAALDYPAVRLFADRARAVRQGFRLDESTAGPVARICAALEGLPLAIELAAARLRTFGVEEIAARLAEHGRFALLSRGDRTAAARHQTLRAVVEWSWDLLTPQERELARRFSVFAGGASLEAVEAICGGPPDGLVDKSLVMFDGERYRMLETVRLFCAERLTGDVRAAHARYYLRLAQRAEPHLRRAEQLAWLARLSAEHANLMAALRHDPETGQRMVAALAAYWWLSGRRSEAGEAAAGLLEPLPGLEEEYVACVLHAVPRAAPEHWERATEIMRAMDRPLRHPFLVALWGMVAGPTGFDGDTMVGGDPWSRALAGLGESLLMAVGGRPGEAEPELEEVLGRFRELGERWGISQALDALALIASWRGDWRRARELHDEALRLLEELGAAEECVDVLTRRAEALIREGDLDAARADLARAEGYARKAGRTGVAHPGSGELARLSGDLDGARARLELALRSWQGGGFGAEGVRARILTALGRLAQASGDLDRARARHREAAAAVRGSPLLADVADAVEGLAGAVPPQEAAVLLGAAVALRGTTVAGDRDVARTVEEARAALGVEAFAALYARGAAMGREEALTAVDAAVSR